MGPIREKRGFWEAKMAPKIEFFELWESLWDIIFHITFCMDFVTIFNGFLEAPTLKNSNFP